MLQGNAVIAQSGGPTAVINSSVCGAVQTWLAAENRPGTIYAAISGIRFFDEELLDLAEQPAEVTPACVGRQALVCSPAATRLARRNIPG